jgi:protein gp37
MYYLDGLRGQDGSAIRRTKADFDKPVQKDRYGNYRIKSGETLRVCMTSDFFLEEADVWRDEAWEMMRERPDVVFFLLTKRPERVRNRLPKDWGEGWENVFFNVTCENQKRADERIPLLLELPFKHKGIMCAPFIGPVSIEKYLDTGQIERVVCGGENYDGCRPCDFGWVQALHAECVAHDVSFTFIETGTIFVKDGRRYHLPDKRLQSVMAWKSGMNYQGGPIEFDLRYPIGLAVPEEERWHPWFSSWCQKCASRPICNGCTRCGRCGQVPAD